MRTDRTTLCSECAIRFATAATCPRCGHTSVFDLRQSGARRNAIRALRTGKRGSISKSIHIDRWGAVYLKFVVPALTVGTFAVATAYHENWMLGGIIAFVAFWLLLALLLGGVMLAYAIYALVIATRSLLGLLWSHRFEPRLPRVITSDEQEFGSLRGVSEIRGRVRVNEPLISPVGHVPCAAFRIIGEGPLGNIDDAGGATFDVVANGETVARVHAHPASILLEAEDFPRTVRPDRNLKTFLTERGVFPERGPVKVAESVLANGDEVVIQGGYEEVSDGENYRDSRRILLFKETAKSPLVIRRSS